MASDFRYLRVAITLACLSSMAARAVDFVKRPGGNELIQLERDEIVYSRFVSQSVILNEEVFHDSALGIRVPEAKELAKLPAGTKLQVLRKVEDCKLSPELNEVGAPEGMTANSWAEVISASGNDSLRGWILLASKPRQHNCGKKIEKLAFLKKFKRG